MIDCEVGGMNFCWLLKGHFTAAMIMLMREHVTQCNGVAHLCVFNSFWLTMDVCGTEE